MLKRLAANFEEYILVLSFAFSVVLIFIQIIMRYVFDNSLSWSEELARYLFLWQIWLGASFATKEKRHLRIEILARVLPAQQAWYVELLALVLWFSFAAFLAFKGSELLLKQIARNQLSPAMQIPMAYAYASVPAGCTLMVIRLTAELYELFSRRGK